jgi:hypothetical protein
MRTPEARGRVGGLLGCCACGAGGLCGGQPEQDSLGRDAGVVRWLSKLAAEPQPCLRRPIAPQILKSSNRSSAAPRRTPAPHPQLLTAASVTAGSQLQLLSPLSLRVLGEGQAGSGGRPASRGPGGGGGGGGGQLPAWNASLADALLHVVGWLAAWSSVLRVLCCASCAVRAEPSRVRC